MKTKIVMIALLGLSLIAGVVAFLFELIELPILLFISIGALALIATNMGEFKSLQEKNYKKLLKDAEDLYKKREISNALKTFEKAARIRPASMETFMGRVQCMRVLMKRNEALEECNKMLSLHPDSPQVLYLKGMVLLDTANPKGALAAFMKIKNTGSELVMVHFLKGQIQEKIGELREAIQSYEEYLALNGPRKEEVLEIINQIKHRLGIAETPETVTISPGETSTDILTEIEAEDNKQTETETARQENGNTSDVP